MKKNDYTNTDLIADHKELKVKINWNFWSLILLLFIVIVFVFVKIIGCYL